MPAHKRHHFVPQFYLKRFSGGKRFIGCFHKQSGRFIDRAPIKGQCALNNFYAWDDEVEKSLGAAEAEAAEVLRKIDRDDQLPVAQSRDRLSLISFIALQSSRTQLAGIESDDLADYYAKLMLSGQPDIDQAELAKVRIGTKFPAALPMSVAKDSIPYLMSLEACLLKSKNEHHFLTSDNPVTLHNTVFSKVDNRGVIGITAKGLQIFYPISPTQAVYLYDPDAYRCPSNTGKRVVSNRDLLQINMLHYFWSGEVVFGNSGASRAFLTAFSKIAQSYPFERSVNQESRHVKFDNERSGSLTRSYRCHSPIETKFRFAKLISEKGENFLAYEDDGINFVDTEKGQSYTFEPISRRKHLKDVDLDSAISELSALY